MVKFPQSQMCDSIISSSTSHFSRANLFLMLSAQYPYNFLAVFLMLVVLPFLLHCIFKHQDQYSHHTTPTTNACMQHSIHSDIFLCIMNFAYIPCPIVLLLSSQ